MESRFLDSIFFSKEKAESLKKLRIINQNLIHIQGLPIKLLNIEILKSQEYFGQYGTIKNITLSRKKNQENFNKVYSVYITYANNKETACAILCVDSLLIHGKIIRAFFGTTKYCTYFLDNKKCRKSKKCKYLHKLVTNKNIIIDDNTNFSYNEHLNMSKKIIEQNIVEIKNNFLNKPKNSKNVLPSIDFIFLSEEQKEKYFSQDNICYIRNNDNGKIDTSIEKNNIMFKNICIVDKKNNLKIKFNNNLIQNDGLNLSQNICIINYVETNNINNFNYYHSVNTLQCHEPFELYNIFKDSIRHILFSKSFYYNVRNAPLEKMEFNYFVNDLLKKGVDIKLLLGGCLDCIKDYM